jgi:hypothetical protein
MHPSNHPSKDTVPHDFAINETGTVITFQFPPAATVTLTGEEARELREFLNRAELRSEAEAAALAPGPVEKPDPDHHSV